eukprot:g78781.t1
MQRDRRKSTRRERRDSLARERARMEQEKARDAAVSAHLAHHHTHREVCPVLISGEGSFTLMLQLARLQRNACQRLQQTPQDAKDAKLTTGCWSRQERRCAAVGVLCSVVNKAASTLSNYCFLDAPEAGGDYEKAQATLTWTMEQDIRPVYEEAKKRLEAKDYLQKCLPTPLVDLVAQYMADSSALTALHRDSLLLAASPSAMQLQLRPSAGALETTDLCGLLKRVAHLSDPNSLHEPSDQDVLTAGYASGLCPASLSFPSRFDPKLQLHLFNAKTQKIERKKWRHLFQNGVSVLLVDVS